MASREEKREQQAELREAKIEYLDAKAQIESEKAKRLKEERITRGLIIGSFVLLGAAIIGLITWGIIELINSFERGTMKTSPFWNFAFGIRGIPIDDYIDLRMKQGVTLKTLDGTDYALPDPYFRLNAPSEEDEAVIVYWRRDENNLHISKDGDGVEVPSCAEEQVFLTPEDKSNGIVHFKMKMFHNQYTRSQIIQHMLACSPMSQLPEEAKCMSPAGEFGPREDVGALRFEYFLQDLSELGPDAIDPDARLRDPVGTTRCILSTYRLRLPIIDGRYQKYKRRWEYINQTEFEALVDGMNIVEGSFQVTVPSPFDKAMVYAIDAFTPVGTVDTVHSVRQTHSLSLDTTLEGFPTNLPDPLPAGFPVTEVLQVWENVQTIDDGVVSFAITQVPLTDENREVYVGRFQSVWETSYGDFRRSFFMGVFDASTYEMIDVSQGNTEARRVLVVRRTEGPFLSSDFGETDKVYPFYTFHDVLTFDLPVFSKEGSVPASLMDVSYQADRETLTPVCAESIRFPTYRCNRPSGCIVDGDNTREIAAADKFTCERSEDEEDNPGVCPTGRNCTFKDFTITTTMNGCAEGLTEVENFPYFYDNGNPQALAENLFTNRQPHITVRTLMGFQTSMSDVFGDPTTTDLPEEYKVRCIAKQLLSQTMKDAIVTDNRFKTFPLFMQYTFKDKKWGESQESFEDRHTAARAHENFHLLGFHDNPQHFDDDGIRPKSGFREKDSDALRSTTDTLGDADNAYAQLLEDSMRPPSIESYPFVRF